jgi:phosphoglycolate phosphatase-like HAD superfamily hydrolase
LLTTHPTHHQAAPLPKTLITFDVDGTLIKSVGTHANKFHKDAFAHAFKVVHDIDTNIDVIPHHGSTDQLVVEAVLKHHGVPHDVVWAEDVGVHRRHARVRVRRRRRGDSPRRGSRSYRGCKNSSPPSRREKTSSSA